MFPEGFGTSGMWWIFPIIGLAVMMIFMFFMFGRGRIKPPWKNSERESGPSGQDFNKEPETVLEILKKRYAKGEISKEEFDQMKNDLG